MKAEMNRRGFIKNSMKAGSILAVPSFMALQPSQERPALPKRAFGKTGVELPLLSMGVMRAENPNLVRAAQENGIVHFDTAHGYQQGRNEEMLGKVFKGTPRENLFISTKLKPGGTPEALAEQFELSLKRLQMDYVDILYLHGPGEKSVVMNGEYLELFKKFRVAGKAKNLGISTHGNEAQMIHAAVDTGVYNVVLTSYNFKQHHTEAMSGALERAHNAGFGLVAMKTMMGGFMDSARTQPVDAGAALKWAWSNPHIHTAIPGFTSFDQLEVCLKAVRDLNMTESEKKFLASVRHLEGLYCQGCRECVSQCPKHLPIPEMMRAFMYSYGYKAPLLARETLDELNLTEDPCSDCAHCVVNCASGFHIAGKISDINRIRRVPADFLV
ncbi:MAG: aldo/keto reductase [Bacteroidales bacterium]|nr:aldo/keto reductase [Bacteroidales bacterium]